MLPLAETQTGLSTSQISTRGSLLCIETRELDLSGFQTSLFSCYTIETFLQDYLQHHILLCNHTRYTEYHHDSTNTLETFSLRLLATSYATL